MATEPQLHPVYASINKPLTIWGAERRLFLVAVLLGGGTFNLLGSLVGGLSIFGVLYAAARWASATDPQVLRLLLNSARLATQYDPITFTPITVRRADVVAAPRPPAGS